MTYVLSANRLKDGSVVYLAADHSWTNQLSDARVLSDDDLEGAGRIGKSAEEENLIVDSYPVEVASDQEPQPTRLRERIRGLGPTVGDHRTAAILGPEG